MADNTKQQIEDLTMVLRGRIESLLKRKQILSGNGPPMAYFQVLQNGVLGWAPATRVYYTSFAVGIEKEPGAPGAWCVNPETMLTATVENFERWLDRGNGTLIWRNPPEVDYDDGRWNSFMRCARLGTDDTSMKILWEIC